MNNQKGNHAFDNNQTEAKATTINTVMAAMLLTIILLFGGIVYKDNNQRKEIEDLNNQKNYFMFKYLNEQSEADKLAKDLCDAKFGKFAHRLDDGRVCRVFGKNNSDAAIDLEGCKINTKSKLPDKINPNEIYLGRVRGKCGALGVEFFIENIAAKQKQ